MKVMIDKNATAVAPISAAPLFVPTALPRMMYIWVTEFLAETAGWACVFSVCVGFCLLFGLSCFSISNRVHLRMLEIGDVVGCSVPFAVVAVAGVGASAGAVCHHTTHILIAATSA